MSRFSAAARSRYVLAEAREQATTISGPMRDAVNTGNGMTIARAISAAIAVGTDASIPRLVLAAYERARKDRTPENLSSLARIAREVLCNATTHGAA